MKATIEPRDAIKGSYRKDQLYRAYKILDPKDGSCIVDARVYFPGSVAYACVWIHDDKIHASGSGKAGGYGYDKESAAVAEALENAGVTLSENIAGVGQHALRDALEATARAVTGKRKFFTVTAFA